MNCRRSISAMPVLVFLLTGVPARAQEPQQQQLDPESIDRAGGRLLVRVRTSNGTSVPPHAMVWLTARAGSLRLSDATRDNAEVLFRNLPLGEYEVRVQAPGYIAADSQVEVLLPSATTDVFVYLLPENAAGARAAPPGPPVLAPKAYKEFEKEVAALRAKNLKEAQQCFERTLKLAPGYAEASYALGIVAIRSNDARRAKEFLTKATELQPTHVQALYALAAVLHGMTDYAAAVRVLERVLALEPDSWKAHWLMSAACYYGNQLEKARGHAERALQVAPNPVPEIRLLYAEVLAAMGELEKAEREIDVLQSKHAGNAAAVQALPLRERLRNAREARVRALPVAVPDSNATRIAAREIALEPVMPETGWAPPDVDERKPAVSSAMTCSLPEVLKATSRRARTLVDSLQRITATERIEHSDLDAAGNTRSHQTFTSEYVVSIQSLRSGNLVVDETRLETTASSNLPVHRTNGLVALAVIFHPFYVEDFDMRCEGLGQLGGEPVWLVHFQQRADRPSRVRAYHTREGRFPVKLKGRAWIAANTHHVLRFESDLLESTPGLLLEREHLVIEYQPVKFLQRQEQLWLPASADLYSRFRGRRYHQRHTFANFMLFSVDVNQAVADGKQP